MIKNILSISVLVLLTFLSIHFFSIDDTVQENVTLEKVQKQPLIIEFEKERTKNPLTNEVPSHLKYLDINNQIMGQIPGLYKTFKEYPNSWSPVDDKFSLLSVQKITYDPNNTETYYFCTGEGWFNADAVRGAGVWKSEDAGKSWKQLPATNNEDFYYCQDIKVHPDNSYIYVSTRNNGIMRSTDGGDTWEKVLGQSVGAIQNTGADIEFTADGDIVVSIGIFNSDGVYISSTGNEGSWNKIFDSSPNNAHRIEIATAPSNANVIYIVTVNSDRIVGGIFKSEDKGQNWQTMSLPGGDRTSLASNQGWYDLILAVDPSNENVIVAGGIHLWRSFNGGRGWVRISQGNRNQTGLPYVHVDQHEIFFQNSDTVYFTNDGGLYVSYDFRAIFPKFTQINKNFNVTQYYAGDISREASNHRVIGGTQDNGTSGKIEKYNLEFEFISGGDGSYCAIDWEDPSYEYSTTQFARMYRNRNGQRTEITNNALSNNTTLFINPMHMDENDSRIIYQASSIGLWRLENARTANRGSWERITTSFGVITAMATSKLAPDKMLIARNGGGILRINDLNNVGPTLFPEMIDPNRSLPNTTYPNCITWDPSDANHALIVFTNYGIPSVHQSKNVLADQVSWSSCSGNLPDIPIRWAAIHPENSDVCYLATETGIYYTTKLDGDNTNWVKINSNMPNVRVDMLKIRASDNTLMIATHGRGFFTAKIQDDYTLVFKEEGPNNIGGRSRSIMLDPNDPTKKKIWAGSVSGGLWVAQNIDSIEVYEERSIPITTAPNDSSETTGIYPNPATNWIKVNVKQEDNEDIRLTMINLDGKIVKQMEFNQSLVDYTIDIQGLSTGLYLVIIENGSEREVLKFVKNFDR